MKRNTIIVLVIALALGAYVYFYEMKHGKARDEEETNKPAFTFKSEDVASLNVTSNNQTIALETNGKDWTISQPVKTDADQASLESLLSGITSATIERSLVMTPGLQNGSGLAQPSVVVEIKLKNGTQHKVTLGRKDPTDASVYALVDQNPNVLLLPASLLDSTNKKLNDLRAKEIVKVLPGDVTSFTIKNQNLTFVAERNAENNWVVKEPTNKVGKEANTSKPFSLLSTQATEVLDIPDEKTKALLAKPVVEASFNEKDKVTKVAISAADGDNVFVRVDGRNEAFKANKSLLDSLNFKLTDVVTEPAATKPEDNTEKKDEAKGETPKEKK
ncbi:MAG: DUF4340 domain-containing protein [Acidobacteria bacterium]|nr:DUF4340 domain-containing protein [Acidobacteriota bacterium]